LMQMPWLTQQHVALALVVEAFPWAKSSGD
jgi:hypothetical protein